MSQTQSHQTISAGTILIEKSTLLPGTLGLENGPTESGWTSLVSLPDRHQLEEKLSAAGWRFFLMAGAIKTVGFGFARPAMIQAALKRLIAAVKLQKCNCLEIDAIATRSFLGLPYVCLSAHSRHIQSGLVFGNHTGV
jgi:hypothetical protein